MKNRSVDFSWGTILRMPMAILLALGIGFLITALFSQDPFEAFAAFLTGPLRFVNRFGDWMEDAITLTLLGLSVSIVFSANQLNLGAEGQMTLGALAAGAVILFLPLPPWWLITAALAAAALAGFLWGMIPAILKAYFQANELVSSLMLNYVAIKIYEYVVTYQLTPVGGGFVASRPFPETASMGSAIPPWPFLDHLRAVFIKQTSVTSFLYVAVLSVVLVGYMIYKTRIGYEIRVVGQNASFARYGGIHIERVVLLSMAISGIFAGLGGAHVAVGIHKRLLLGMSLGFGFEGVVVSLLAKNNPKWIPLSALVYSYLRTGADVMERSTDISREMVLIIQGLIILFITSERVFFRKTGQGALNKGKFTGKAEPEVKG